MEEFLADSAKVGGFVFEWDVHGHPGIRQVSFRIGDPVSHESGSEPATDELQIRGQSGRATLGMKVPHQMAFHTIVVVHDDLEAIGQIPRMVTLLGRDVSGTLSLVILVGILGVVDRRKRLFVLFGLKDDEFALDRGVGVEVVTEDDERLLRVVLEGPGQQNNAEFAQG